ncbi:hypothetical protein FGG08_004871 [Glutinoglossum americanum]|uniref:Protein kinase domain-containing protein n=1 Tax=Glutinoglossum americanum TaxID=1670608 RepID=A0A9P8I6K8_9PEZI|nr:hypothetical protein FGG08_004871 [Glutinoglossum americanum]
MYSRIRSREATRPLLSDQQHLLEYYTGPSGEETTPHEAANSRTTIPSIPAATPETLRDVDLFAYLQVPFFDIAAEDTSSDIIDRRAVTENRGSEGNVFPVKSVCLSDGTTKDIQTVWKVSKARHGNSNGLVGEGHAESLKREIRAMNLARSHPNVQQLLGGSFRRPLAIGIGWKRAGVAAAGREGWNPVLLMEHAPCSNLDSMLKSHPGLRFGLKQHLALDIGHGIYAIHKAGLIWGDGKPENILVFITGNSQDPFLLKITDFGNSRSKSGGELEKVPPLGSEYWIKPLACFSDSKGTQWLKKTPHSSGPSAREIFVECKRFDIFVFGLITCWLFLEPEKFKKEIYGPGHLKWDKDNWEVQTEQIEKTRKVAISAVEEKYSKDMADSGRAPGCSIYDVVRLGGALVEALRMEPNPDIRYVLRSLDSRGVYTSRQVMSSHNLEKALISCLEKTDTFEDARIFITSPGHPDEQSRVLRELQNQKYICRKALAKAPSLLSQTQVGTGVHTSGSDGASADNIAPHTALDKTYKVFKNTIDNPLPNDVSSRADILCRACEVLALARLEELVAGTEMGRLLSCHNDSGYSPLSYAIRSDDPLVYATRLRTLGEIDLLSRETAVVKYLLSRNADIDNISPDSDTALLWAVRHGSLNVIKYLLDEPLITRGGNSVLTTGQVGLVSTDRDGVDWTPLRAAMGRQDDENIIMTLIGRVNLNEERERAFESGYGYMNLCAFYEGRWGVRLAEILVEKAFDLNRAAVSSLASGHQETPLATAIIHGNQQLADFLYEHKADPYHSVIRPSIRPPEDVRDWFEASIVPDQCYTEDEFQENIPRVWGFPFVWRFYSVSIFFPFLVQKRMRLTHQFLLEYSLRCGYRGPYMSTWVRYETVLDHVTCQGLTSSAMYLVEKLVEAGEIRIIQRAIGVGIHYLSEKRRSETDLQRRRVLDRVASIVSAMVNALQDVSFLSDEILLDTTVSPESYWDNGRFIFGLPPENVTTLIHLTVMGGLRDVAQAVRTRKLPLAMDGAGVTPIRRVDLCLLSVEKLPEAFREEMLGDYREIREHLKKMEKLPLNRRWLPATRGWAMFLAWGVLMSMIVFLPMLFMCNALEQVVGWSNIRMVRVVVVFLVVVGSVVVVQKQILGLPRSGVRAMKFLKREGLRAFLEEVLAP